MARTNKPVTRKKPEPRAKQEAKKFLGTVPEEFIFWCNDGRVFRDMQELGEGLVTMSDETFAYHCNQEKCDFGNWVRDIIGDQKLANDIAKVKNRVQAAKVVTDRISALNKQLV